MADTGAIIITGGTKGIGFATAVELIQMGFRRFVLGYYRSDDAAVKAKEDLEKTPGVQVVLIKGDVADTTTTDSMINAVEEVFQGSLYAIVHSAGLYLTHTKDNHEECYDQYQRIYAKAFWRIVEKGVALMQKSSSGGRIVGVSSPGANLLATPRPGYFLPGCAKASMEYIARHYATVLAPQKITCNIVIPGITDTSGWGPIDHVALAARRCPMKEVIPPRDVGAAIGFLLSQKAGFITGTVLPVDGGLLSVFEGNNFTVMPEFSRMSESEKLYPGNQ